MNQSNLKQKFDTFIISAKKFSKAFAIKAWDYIKFAKIELIVIVGSIFLDLLVKFIIAKTMTLYEVKTVIPYFFNLRYVHNYKAAFGGSFGLDKVLSASGLRAFFIITTIIALIVFIVFMYRFRNSHMFARVGLALIIGGAIGNFYDRIVFSYVRDFAEIVFFGLDIPFLGGETFAIFNIADAVLVAGTITFCVFLIFIYKSPKELFVGPIYQPDFIEENSTVNDDGKTNE